MLKSDSKKQTHQMGIESFQIELLEFLEFFLVHFITFQKIFFFLLLSTRKFLENYAECIFRRKQTPARPTVHC